MANIVHLDFETRSALSPKDHGGWNYIRHPSTRILVMAWKVDNGPVKAWVPINWLRPAGWDREALQKAINALPDGPAIQVASNEDVQDLFSLVTGEDAPVICAWNADFDRDVWNVVGTRYGFPETPISQWICSMIQAHASQVPANLKGAAEELGCTAKINEGKELIKQLCNSEVPWSVENVLAMPRFVQYCGGDVIADQEVFETCRRFTVEEWQQYHLRVEINQRGIPIDREFCEAAVQLAGIELADVDNRLREITAGYPVEVTKHTQNERMRNFALHLLEGDDSLTANRIRKLMTNKDKASGWCFDKDVKAKLWDPDPDEVGSLLKQDRALEDLGDRLPLFVDFVQACQDASGAATYKYKKILAYAGEDDRLHYAIQHGKAGASGRNSSIGVQIHNLVRKMIGSEDNRDLQIEVMESIIQAVHEGKIEEVIARLKETYGLGIQGILSRLLRPTICAKPGHTFVFSDLRQIEARGILWLMDDPGAEMLLNAFREGKDIYKIAAAGIYGVSYEEVTKAQRQIGKVIALGCQYGLGASTFLIQCLNWGIHMTPEKAKEIVDAWRRANPCYPRFWYALKDAAWDAVNNPGEWFDVGRVSYVFDPDLMGGTLQCYLPSGRPLSYRGAKIVNVWDEEREQIREVMKYRKVKGSNVYWNNIWHGLLAENITQAVCTADYRRYCEEDPELRPYLIAETHDELLAEVPIDKAAHIAEVMAARLCSQPEWAHGLPTADETTVCPFYTK